MKIVVLKKRRYEIMKSTTIKKWAGTLMIGILITTLGTLLVVAQPLEQLNNRNHNPLFNDIYELEEDEGMQDFYLYVTQSGVKPYNRYYWTVFNGICESQEVDGKCEDIRKLRLNLTETQITAVRKNTYGLYNYNTSCEEIKTEIQLIIQEFRVELPRSGLKDEQKDKILNKQIEHNELISEIRNKVKVLRDQGATREEIRGEIDTLFYKLKDELMVQ
jgi:hypothetical protein